MTINSNENDQDCNHFEHLKHLPTFTAKLVYWSQEVCKDDLRFEIYCSDKSGAKFKLEPKTDDERCELNKFWLNRKRLDFAKENRSVYRSDYLSNAFQDRTAFVIQTIDAYKKDLEIRLSTAVRRKDLFQSELEIITNAINAVAGQAIFGSYRSYTQEIKELRTILETKRPYDFTFRNEISPYDKAHRMAEIWDIIEYESYLKDMLVIPENEFPSVSVEKILKPKPLTHTQISLIRIYEMKPISKTSAQHIANDYGISAPNAGKVLLKKYNDLDNYEHRIRRRKIESDIEVIIPMLTGEALEKAKSELNKIRNYQR